jgi:hypothetical protein
MMDDDFSLNDGNENMADVTGNVVISEDILSELQAQLDLYKDQSLGYHEGELGVRAREAWHYYYGELPNPVTKGSSQWIDRSVWESVNGMLQEAMNVFTTDVNETVKFMPINREDGNAAKAATQMVNQIMLKENDGYQVLHDVFKESFVVRTSFVKRYWAEKAHTEVETFSGLTEEEIESYIADVIMSDKIDPAMISFEAEIDPETKMASGSISRKIKKEGVHIEFTPFEQVLVEPSATSFKDANYVGHRVRKTKDELLTMGFDPDRVEELSPASSDIEAGVIANARINNISPLNVSDVVMVGDAKADKLWLYENYMKTSLISGEIELLQIFTINGEVLEINRVSEVPFVNINPLPTPGFIWGESLVDITKDIQDLNTQIVRGLIDNTMNANHRRYIATKGQYDRRSLLDNRPGGVVEVTAPGAIELFPYHPLPQGMINLLEYVEQKKEQRTGVTRLGQGLNPDVFKNDNAHATVSDMLSASMNRLRMVCRNLAETGISELMLGIYRLVRENGKEPLEVRTSKGIVKILPRDLPPREGMALAYAIGTNERRERGQNMMMLMQSTMDGPTAQFMLPEQQYHMACEIYKAFGIPDVENFLTPVDELPPPPEPSPADLMEVQIKEEQIKLIQANIAKVLNDTKVDQMKIEFEQTKAADDFTLKREESMSKQDESADKMTLEEMKLALEGRKVEIQAQQVKLEEQRLLIEAQLENDQKRGVDVGKQ